LVFLLVLLEKLFGIQARARYHNLNRLSPTPPLPRTWTGFPSFCQCQVLLQAFQQDWTNASNLQTRLIKARSCTIAYLSLATLELLLCFQITKRAYK